MKLPRPPTALLNAWYAKAREAGYSDIEDAEGRLKRPTASSNLIEGAVAPSIGPVFAEEEQFANHPQFWDACEAVSKHANSRLSAGLASLAWHDYCKGFSYRDIAASMRVSKDAVARVIKGISVSMHLLGGNVVEDENVKIVLRGADKTDEGFIYATWRNALWYDEKRDDSRAPQFYKDASRFIKIMLQAPTTNVRIACLESDPSTIAGYSIMSTTNLEWVYVKINYRKQGVAKLLIADLKTVSRPRTRIGISIVANKKLKVLNE